MVNVGRVLARVMLSAIFFTGFTKFQNIDAMVPYGLGKVNACGLGGLITSFGFEPATVVDAGLWVTTVVEVLGAVLLFFGFEKVGAALLFSFLAMITPIMHFPLSGGNIDQMEMIQLLKNLALAGAMLYIASNSRAEKSAPAEAAPATKAAPASSKKGEKKTD